MGACGYFDGKFSLVTLSFLFFDLVKKNKNFLFGNLKFLYIILNNDMSDGLTNLINRG